MVGMALRKYAEAHSMTCDGGYVYGVVNGRHIAMLDGNGVKMLQIYLYPPEQQVDNVVLLQAKKILESDERGEYRLIRRNAVNVSGGRAVVAFQDGPGAMKRVAKYIDSVMPRLEEVPLAPDLCPSCGKPLEDEVHYLRIDDYILPTHRECLDRMSAKAGEIRPYVKNSSVLRGTVGAILGASVGAILWAVVYMMGYITSIVGMAIGFLTNFLYERFGGRRSRVQAAIVLLAVFFGVLLGQVAGTTAVLCREYDELDSLDKLLYTRTHYVQISWEMLFNRDQETVLENMYDRILESDLSQTGLTLPLKEEFVQNAWNPEYNVLRQQEIDELNENFGTGIVFALIGCMGLLSRLHKDTNPRFVKRLK